MELVSGVGLLGAALLPLAWLLDTYARYESGGLEAADTRSVGLYIAASVLLTYHAFQIKDLPLIVLGVSMAMFTSTELVLLLHVKRGGGM